MNVIKCDDCCGTFSRKDSLKKHHKQGRCKGVSKKMRTVCFLCKKDFHTIFNLERHMSQHSAPLSPILPSSSSSSSSSSSLSSSSSSSSVPSNHIPNFDDFEDEECVESSFHNETNGEVALPGAIITIPTMS
jgi:hypothetical protein